MTTYFVTRHAQAKAWAEEEGFPIDAMLNHLEPDLVQAGDCVLGTLPVNLAALVCAKGGRYFHLSLNVPEGWRGRELTVEDMRQCGAALQEFRVEPV